jgi:hypothetical protein
VIHCLAGFERSSDPGSGAPWGDDLLSLKSHCFFSRDRAETNFDQLGFRVPFMTISAFAKPHYVSHAVNDLTSVLALIEKRFMTGSVGASGGCADGTRPHLTRRDLDADTLDDMFDFEHSLSLNTPVGIALLPTNDRTPAP